MGGRFKMLTENQKSIQITDLKVKLLENIDWVLKNFYSASICTPKLLCSTRAFTMISSSQLYRYGAPNVFLLFRVVICI